MTGIPDVIGQRYDPCGNLAGKEIDHLVGSTINGMSRTPLAVSIEVLAEMYEQGKNLQDIATTAGVRDVRTVRRHLVEAGVEIDPHRTTPGKRAKLSAAARKQPSLGRLGQQALLAKLREEARERLGPEAADEEIAAAAEEVRRARMTSMAFAGGAAKSRKAARSRPAQLNDREWLQKEVATRGVREIAADLGCGPNMVHGAVRRFGIDMLAAQRAETVRPLIGRRFGMLTVRSEAPAKSKSGNLRVLADCDCGGSKVITIWTLENHGPGWDHCGCQSAARWSDGSHARTHGHSGSGGRKRATPTYLSWQSMKDRCYRPGTNGYEHFGGRGITVCDRWRESFAAFLEDMGERPDGMTLDREDVDGNYEPGNCRWATPKQQSANRRQAVWLSRHHWQTILDALLSSGTIDALDTFDAVTVGLKRPASQARTDSQSRITAGA